MKTYLPRAPIRMLAFTVIFAMLASLLPAIPQEASAATMPGNPRLGDSEVTWDCVYFGSYPQGANGELEKIKWRVLSVNGDEALLLADKNLDCKKYNETYTDVVTWETSTIRSWLNGYGAGSNQDGKDYASGNFMDTAFTSAEQGAINQKTIQNPDNQEYGTVGGNDTKDKVFLLSIEEVTKPAYGFPSDYSEHSKTRRALNTEYAKAQGAWTSTSTEYAGNGYWWLRSRGYSDYAAYVYCYGHVDRGGNVVSIGGYAVRPALFLNLKSNLWTDAGTVSSEGKVNDIDMSSLLNYDQYQAKYYSQNADFLVNRDMTYTQIEDNYTPTAYALNNMLSFGWSKKFGFTDDAQIWETLLCDILLRRSADDNLSVNWEKNALELDKELCDLASKNDIVDLDGKLNDGNRAKLENMAENCDEFHAIMNASSTKAVKKLLNAAGTAKEFIASYAKYIELRKVVDADTKAFLTQMKETENYRDIPAFRRALDAVLQHAQVDSEKLAQLVIGNMAADKLITKAMNVSVETIVNALIPEVWAVVDFTKESTIFLMQTVCGTSELAQTNVYLYMLDRIDESATEAFRAAASDCLASNGQNSYRAVNGGLRFLIDLKSYGVQVCRTWNDIIATDILTRLTTNQYTNVKRAYYDMANSHFNQKHASTKEEKKQFIEEKCAADEKYINAILKNQAGFARIQWYAERGGTAQENECLVIFKIKNPDDTTTLHVWLAPKNMAVQFPTVETKSGYLPVNKWYTDEACTQEADQNARITKNTVFYTKYVKNVWFSPAEGGGIKIDSVQLPVSLGARAKTSVATVKNISEDAYEIPSYIEGYRVTELGDDIFASCPEVTSVSIPGTIVKISGSAFDSLSKSTTYQYVEGSAAEKYVQEKGYQNTAAHKELYFKTAVANMYVGDSKALELVKTGSCAGDDITWSSSDEAVASVKSGMVSAKKSGEVKITVSNGNISAACKVVVTEKNEKPVTNTTVKNSQNSKATAAAKVKKPKKITLKKAKSTKRGTLKLTWKRDKTVTGYQAVVATDKKFKKNKKSATIKKNKTVTKTFTKLKRKKTYYAKVRAYKKSGGKTVYGAYSKVKKKKVK